MSAGCEEQKFQLSIETTWLVSQNDNYNLIEILIVLKTVTVTVNTVTITVLSDKISIDYNSFHLSLKLTTF